MFFCPRLAGKVFKQVYFHLIQCNMSGGSGWNGADPLVLATPSHCYLTNIKRLLGTNSSKCMHNDGLYTKMLSLLINTYKYNVLDVKKQKSILGW